MKQIIQNIKENYKLVLIVLVSGLFLGWLFFHSSGETTTKGESAETLEQHNHEHDEATIWTCSMHPQIRQDKPGQCPICGMDLIPLTSLTSAEEQSDPNAIVMTESAAKLAEIQTITVKRGTPEKSLFLQGKVQPDERNITELTARFGGRIEKLFVNFTGQRVQKGEKLATIYSPDLVTAQRELLEAVGYKESRPALYIAAKGKLKLWDLSDEQISAIETRGEPQLYFDINSPMSGTVTMRHVALGDYVKTGNAMFQIIDLSHVWVLFDAYESDLPWIKKGDRAEFTIQSLPGKTYTEKVAFIDPFMDAVTRVAKVRVELNNPQRKIKPEMFVNGYIESKIAENSKDLLIPKSAVLWTGKKAVVYVKKPNAENPTFNYRQIVLGPEAGNFYVVAGGLEQGEEIATNGVFKIDAAAQLQGLPSMMNPEGGDSGAGSMPGMDMGGGNKSMNKKTQTSNEASSKPSETDPAFKAQLTKVYENYLNMKNDFVATDAREVSQEAKKVENALQSVDMELLKGDAHMAWMDQLKTLKSSIASIGQSSDIEKQREAFAKFNLAFYKSLKMFGLKNDTAYYQYCPMAFGEKGAYWFSDTKEIKNPYFGDEMLGCGETRETLK
jgi:membrane fusion protein, copper/silver efflux system